MKYYEAILRRISSSEVFQYRSSFKVTLFAKYITEDELSLRISRKIHTQGHSTESPEISFHKNRKIGSAFEKPGQEIRDIKNIVNPIRGTKCILHNTVVTISIRSFCTTRITREKEKASLIQDSINRYSFLGGWCSKGWCEGWCGEIGRADDRLRAPLIIRFAVSLVQNPETGANFHFKARTWLRSIPTVVEKGGFRGRMIARCPSGRVTVKIAFSLFSQQSVENDEIRCLVI